MSENLLVIFDVDGVLSDTGPVHYESWKKLADEIGVEFNWEFFEETFGQKSVPITRKLVGEVPSSRKIKKWADLKEYYYREMVKDKLEPLSGVLTLLKDLRREGFKLAVGSSGPPANVDLLLKSLNIKHFFDIIITSADVSKSKPSPDAFLKVAKKLNITSEHCLVIEDAPVGIEAAKRANMKVIALTTTHPQEDLKDADLILSELTKLTSKKILNLIKNE